MIQESENATRKEPVSAEDGGFGDPLVRRIIEPVVKEIARKKKRAAVLQRRLGDHFRLCEPLDAPADMTAHYSPERSKKYAAVVSKIFGIPIIEQPEDLASVLESNNMKPKRTVILVDHNVAENFWHMNFNDCRSLDWYQVELALACPCCTRINFHDSVVWQNQDVSNLFRFGFKIFRNNP